MPFYHALVRPGLLDDAGREAFAGDVVDVHCGVTGAPPSFVHVLVTEADERLAADLDAAVMGTIRSGRTADQKATIHRDLAAAMATRAGIDAAAVRVTTSDIEASRTMEAGQLLPEPGSPEEDAWKATG